MENNREKMQNLEWIFERQLHWIAASEIKTAAILTVSLAMLGALASAFTLNVLHSCVDLILLFGATILLLLSLFCAGMVILPRLDGPVNSLLFFGSISNLSRKSYISRILSCSDEDMLFDLATQIHRNAEVAQIKHRWASRALYALLLSVLPWALTLLSSVD